MAIPRKKNSVPTAYDATASELMEIFRFAYQNSTNDLARLQRLQNSYDGYYDEANLQTISNIPVPVLYNMVEKQLPEVTDLLFPDFQWLNVIPSDPSRMDMETIRRAEFGLTFILRKRMKMPYRCLPSLKDNLKLGIAFAIVEPARIFSSQAAEYGVANAQGVPLLRTFRRRTGREIYTARYRHVSPGRVIVYKDGDDFRGENPVSWTFFCDFEKEAEFRRKAESGYYTMPDGVNADEMVEWARAAGYNMEVPNASIIANLGGIKEVMVNHGRVDLPVRIPIIRCYGETRHADIVCGRWTVREIVSNREKLRNPMLRLCATPDAERFYPLGPSEAGDYIARGINVWMNALFDLTSSLFNPLTAYNREAFGGREPRRGANGFVPMNGPVQGNIDTIKPPPIPGQLFDLGSIMQQMYGEATGQNPMGQNTPPGYLRSGVYAFERLLNTINARTRLAAAVLETSFHESLIEQVIAVLQEVMDSSPDEIVYRRETGNGRFSVDSELVTAEDFAQIGEVEIDLRAKYRMMSDKNAEYDRMKDDPYFSAYDVRAEFLQDQRRAIRLLKSREECERIQREMLEAQMAEAEAAEQQALAAAKQANEPMMPPQQPGPRGSIAASPQEAAVGGGQQAMLPPEMMG